MNSPFKLLVESTITEIRQGRDYLYLQNDVRKELDIIMNKFQDAMVKNCLTISGAHAVVGLYGAVSDLSQGGIDVANQSSADRGFRLRFKNTMLDILDIKEPTENNIHVINAITLSVDQELEIEFNIEK